MFFVSCGITILSEIPGMLLLLSVDLIRFCVVSILKVYVGLIVDGEIFFSRKIHAIDNFKTHETLLYCSIMQ